jgi:hypothetical protein
MYHQITKVDCFQYAISQVTLLCMTNVEETNQALRIRHYSTRDFARGDSMIFALSLENT